MLFALQEYKLALLQCYGRYLQKFISVNLDDIIDDVHRFKSTFFPNGFRDKNAALTVGVFFVFFVKDVHRFKISNLFYPSQMYFILLKY